LYRSGAVLVCVAVFSLALPHLNDSMWTDEERTMWYAGAAPQYGPVELSTSYERVAENLWQAPGYFLIMNRWGRAFGWSEFTMRLFSVYAALLAVAVTYRTATRLYNPEVGFYAAFALGINTFFIHHAHDMRTYTLNVLLTALLLLSYVSLHRRQHVIVWYVVLLASATGLLYTHYFNAFGVAALGLYHLFTHVRRPTFWPVMGVLALSGVLFLPWLDVLLSGLSITTVDDRFVRNMSILELINGTLSMFSNEARAIVILLALVGIRKQRPYHRMLLFWVGLALAGAFLASRLFPALTEVKYLMFAFPAMAVIVAVGMRQLSRMGVPAAVIMAVWFSLAIWNLYDVQAQERIQSSDWEVPLKEFRTALENRTLPTDSVMFHLAEGAEEANRNEMMDFYMYDLEVIRAVQIPSNRATPDTLYYDRVRAASERADRVWMGYEIGRRDWRVGPVTDTILPEAGFVQCGSLQPAQNISMSLLAVKPNRENAVTFTTPEDGTIDIFTLAPITATHELNIGWKASSDVPPGTYSVSAQVYDGHGMLITHVDYGIAGSDFACVYEQLQLLAQPDEAYGVRYVVYNWQTGDRLPRDR
ncbi:MAG: glycosyltransferase family 39 protein, partial [Chloroflexota bacterium]